MVSSTTGNLSSKADVSYTYGDTSHKHAVTALSNGSSYVYDANGNMTTRVVGGQTFNLTFDGENRLVAVSGAATASFVYNGDGQRVKSTVGGVTTIFIGNYAEWDVSTSTMKKYYYAGSSRVAMKTGSGSTYFLLGDHLGSTSLVVDGSGQQQTGSPQGYMPWGETRFGGVGTKYQYTGQYNEASLGLYYYGARWYDTELSRWISSDSIIPSNKTNFSPLVVDYHEKQLLERLNTENSDSQDDKKPSLSTLPVNSIAFDRYSYSNNNPLCYKDPDGHFAFLIPLLAGALIGGGISTAAYLIGAKASGQEASWAGAAGAFAGGAVAGAVSVIATPLAGTLLGAAGISATGTALVAGTAAVNAAGGAASYLAGGYTQNAVDTAMGNTPTFEPTLGGAAFNVAVAGVLSPLVGAAFPVANNTMSSLCQASHFIPGRTIGTLKATQNAQHLYAQALVATGLGYYAGWEYGRR